MSSLIILFCIMYRMHLLSQYIHSTSAVASIITGGAGVLAYLVAWILTPNEGQKSSIPEKVAGQEQDSYSG